MNTIQAKTQCLDHAQATPTQTGTPKYMCTMFYFVWSRMESLILSQVCPEGHLHGATSDCSC